MQTPKSDTPLFPVMLFLISIITTQFGAGIAAKYLFPLTGIEGASALRYLLSAIMLGVIFKPWRMRIPRHNWASIFFYGVSLGCMGFFFYLSIKRIPLGIAVGLEILGPLSMAVFGSRKITDIIWIALAALGIWLLLPHADTSESLDPVGIFFALLAGFFWVVYAYFGRKVASRHGARTVALGALIAAMIFLPVGIIQTGLSIFTPQTLLIALSVAILSTAIPFTLELITLAKIPLRVYGTLTSLEPAIASISGIIVLNQQLSWLQWVAILSICAASVGTTIGIKPSAAPAKLE